MGQVSSIGSLFNGNDNDNNVGVVGQEETAETLASLLLDPCMKGDLDRVKRLVGERINATTSARDVVNAQDSAGNASIHGAVFGNHIDVVKYLVGKCGADYMSSNGIGCSPLWLAAGYGHDDILRYLLEYIMKNINSSEDEDIYYLNAFNAVNSTGDTPLIAAAFRGHSIITDIILSQAESVNDNHQVILRKVLTFENKGGDSALSVAAGMGHVETVETLLKWSKKVDINDNLINKRNSNGLTPLLVACERGHEIIACTLVKNGASPLRDKNGASPLAVAAFCGCLDVVEKLLELDFGKDLLNVRDGTGGSTPLWLAARTGNKKMVELLLQYGANQNITNKDELSPFEAAVKYEKRQVIEVFEQISKANSSSTTSMQSN